MKTKGPEKAEEEEMSLTKAQERKTKDQVKTKRLSCLVSWFVA